MILVNELKGKMKAKCFTQADIAKLLGVSTKTFNSKLNKGILNSDEIIILIKVLEIQNPSDIFFAE